MSLIDLMKWKKEPTHHDTFSAMVLENRIYTFSRKFDDLRAEIRRMKFEDKLDANTIEVLTSGAHAIHQQLNTMLKAMEQK